jgi:hypothetical protein
MTILFHRKILIIQLMENCDDNEDKQTKESVTVIPPKPSLDYSEPDVSKMTANETKGEDTNAKIVGEETD